MPDEVSYQVIRNFGPSVFKVKIPNKILRDLNDHVDGILESEEKQKKLDHGQNLVGDVTQEILLDKDLVTKTGWLKFLSSCVQRWVLIETGKKITKFNMQQSWIVRQFENEYNPTHWHTGHISGAGFLKVPKSFGSHKQKKINTSYSGGKLQLIHGSRMFLSHSILEITPEIGDFYFFPNYLMHTVFPFKNSNEERRSISFNASIDEDIYHVYR